MNERKEENKATSLSIMPAVLLPCLRSIQLHRSKHEVTRIQEAPVYLQELWPQAQGYYKD